MPQTRPLTEEEVNALRAFAATYKRGWKRFLLAAWMGERHDGISMIDKEGPVLRRLRNELGTQWLERYKLPPQEAPAPAPVTPFPVMSGTDAEAIGYASFNNVPTLVVDVPDGGFTISMRTSEGHLMTAHFAPGGRGEAPRCVDVALHTSGTFRDNHGTKVPTFDAVAFGKGTTLYDSRKAADGGAKPTIVAVMLPQKGGETVGSSV